MKTLFKSMIMIIITLIVLSPIIKANNEDTEPPIISFQEKGIVAETWADIYWETNEEAIGGVEWGLTPNYGYIVNESGNYSIQHYINLTGLTRNTNYYVRIFATDQNNNTGYFTFELGTFPINDGEESNESCFLSFLIGGIFIAVITISSCFSKRKK